MRADKGGEDSKERRVYTQLPRVCVCVCVCVRAHSCVCGGAGSILHILQRGE